MDHPLRVKWLSQTDQLLRLEVLEVLRSGSSLAAGDVIEATWSGAAPCYYGRCPDLRVGDEAFAFYVPSRPPLPACDARASCIAQCEAERDESKLRWWVPECPCGGYCGEPVLEEGRDCDEECEDMTADACPERPAQDDKRGRITLAPWTDPIVFVEHGEDQIAVPIDQLEGLWITHDGDAGELKRCRERFGDWTQLFDDPG